MCIIDQIILNNFINKEFELSNQAQTYECRIQLSLSPKLRVEPETFKVQLNSICLQP